MQRKLRRAWQKNNSDRADFQPGTRNNTARRASQLAKKLLPPVATVGILLASMTSGYANPTGGTVTAGSGTISKSGNTETITQTTNKIGRL